MFNTSVFRAPGRRSAFTLVELLVVIAIIGILIALLLPAVQAAREAARRMQCTNNLKQIGLALHNYHDTFKCFPPGAIAFLKSDGTWVNGEAEWGFAAFILPYMEQKPLYDQLDIDTNILDTLADKAHPLFPLLQTPIESLICPSSKSEPINGKNSINGENLGVSNYPGVAGFSCRTNTPDASGTDLDFPYENNGIFFACAKKSIAFRDITDGTSNVFAVGERPQRVYAAVWPGVGNINNKNQMRRSVGWVCYKMNVPAPPNNPARRGFGSEHPDGANFLLCDGSVQFVSDLIEFDLGGNADDEDINSTAEYQTKCALMGVYQLLGMREDGYPIDKNAF